SPRACSRQLGHDLLELVGLALELQLARRLAVATPQDLRHPGVRVLPPPFDRRRVDAEPARQRVYRRLATHQLQHRLLALLDRAPADRARTSASPEAGISACAKTGATLSGSSHVAFGDLSLRSALPEPWSIPVEESVNLS